MISFTFSKGEPISISIKKLSKFTNFFNEINEMSSDEITNSSINMSFLSRIEQLYFRKMIKTMIENKYFILDYETDTDYIHFVNRYNLKFNRFSIYVCMYNQYFKKYYLLNMNYLQFCTWEIINDPIPPHTYDNVIWTCASRTAFIPNKIKKIRITYMVKKICANGNPKIEN